MKSAAPSCKHSRACSRSRPGTATIGTPRARTGRSWRSRGAHCRKLDVEEDRVGALGLEPGERRFGRVDHDGMVPELEQEVAGTRRRGRPRSRQSVPASSFESSTIVRLSRRARRMGARPACYTERPGASRRRSILSGYLPVAHLRRADRRLAFVSLAVARLLRPSAERGQADELRVRRRSRSEPRGCSSPSVSISSARVHRVRRARGVPVSVALVLRDAGLARSG